MQERKSPETALEDLPDAATADQLTEALRVAEETAAEASATKAYSSYFFLNTTQPELSYITRGP